MVHGYIWWAQWILIIRNRAYISATKSSWKNLNNL